MTSYRTFYVTWQSTMFHVFLYWLFILICSVMKHLHAFFLVIFVRFGALFYKIIKISICLGIKHFSARRFNCHLARISYQSLINYGVVEILFIYHRLNTSQSIPSEPEALQLSKNILSLVNWMASCFFTMWR